MFFFTLTFNMGDLDLYPVAVHFQKYSLQIHILHRSQ